MLLYTRNTMFKTEGTGPR